jgi:hypothetical protein
MASMKGVHSLVRVASDMLTLGVDPGRIVPVVNQAPRSPRSRAAVATAVRELLAPATGPRRVASPLFLPVRRVDEALRDGVRLPSGLGAPLAAALADLLDGTEPAPDRTALQRIRPGGLGTWSEQVAGG